MTLSSTRPPFQRSFLLLTRCGQGVGAGGVDDGQARDAVDEAELFEFGEGLAEGAGVAEVAAGDDDPVGQFPAELFEDAVHDGLLAFEPEGVERVDQVDVQFAADILDLLHAVVEVACDLEGAAAVVHGLAEFAEGDLARADEDGALEAAAVGVEGHRGGGVAGGGAGAGFGADHAGVAEGGGHAVVFERAGGVEAFVLEEEPAGLHAELRGQAVSCCCRRSGLRRW